MKAKNGESLKVKRGLCASKRSFVWRITEGGVANGWKTKDKEYGSGWWGDVALKHGAGDSHQWMEDEIYGLWVGRAVEGMEDLPMDRSKNVRNMGRDGGGMWF